TTSSRSISLWRSSDRLIRMKRFRLRRTAIPACRGRDRMLRIGTVSRCACATPKISVTIALACAVLHAVLVCSPQLLWGANDHARSSRKLSFNREIRPILAENCFKCHGPDAKQRKGKLRLDDEHAAKAAAGSGSVAIVPGKVEESELYNRITAEDADVRMPPK